MTLLACLLGTPLSLATADAAGSEVASGVSPNIAAFRGVVAWRGHTTGANYALYVREDARTRRIPGVSATQEFSFDVGPDGHGGATVVLTQCRGGHCRLYAVDGDRRGIHPLAAKAAEPSSPSVWGSRIAFLSKSNRITLGRTDRGSTQNGPAGTLGDDTGPLALALRGTTLAFAWRGTLGSCTTQTNPDGQRTEIFVAQQGSTPRLVTVGCEAGPVTGVSLIGWVGSDLLLNETLADGTSRLRLISAGGKTLKTGPLPGGDVQDIAADGGTLYYTVRDGSRSRLMRSKAALAAYTSGS